eukprot:6179938-Pleurochrysis_carterae.AAC.1
MPRALTRCRPPPSNPLLMLALPGSDRSLGSAGFIVSIFFILLRTVLHSTHAALVMLDCYHQQRRCNCKTSMIDADKCRIHLPSPSM